MKRGVKNGCNGAANGQQQHGQCATAHIVVIIVGLRIRNTRHRALTGGDCPIVRISHHTIVASSQIEVMEDLAPSFAAFIEDYVSKEAEELFA